MKMRASEDMIPGMSFLGTLIRMVIYFNAGGFAAETNLLCIDQAFQMFFVAVQDYFGHYLSDAREHADTHQIVALTMDALLRILDDHSLLPLSGKGLAFGCLYERKQQVYRNTRSNVSFLSLAFSHQNFY